MSLQPPKSGLFPMGAPLPPPVAEGNNEKSEPNIKNNKAIFSNILENLFANILQGDPDDQSDPITIPFAPKKSAENQSDEKNQLLNSLLSPNFFFQNPMQPKNDLLSIQPKESLQNPTNNLIKMDLTPVDNFSIGEYKFYPIYPDNLKIPQNIQTGAAEEKPLQNLENLKSLQKYDAVDLQLIKNNIIPFQDTFQNEKESFQDLQKGDLVFIKPMENSTKDTILSTLPKMNIEISNLEPANLNEEKTTLNKNVANNLEKTNTKQPTQQVIDFGENFYGYPVSHLENNNSLKTDYYLFKKENTLEVEKQILIGILSKDNSEEKNFVDPDTQKQMKPLLLGYQEDKPKFSKAMTIENLKYNIDKLFGQYLKDSDEGSFNDFDNGVARKNFKSFFTLTEKPITNNQIEEKEFISGNLISDNDENVKDFKFEDSKRQQDLFKKGDESLKQKNNQTFGNVPFENITKEKKGFDFSKNSISQISLEKTKLETSRNKDLKEDAFFSFMSSQSENEGKENKKGVEEKISNDAKGIVFEKGISSQTATPIIVADKSNADYSSSIISTATRRAIDLSSQLQARGGGSAKIQIQDDKLGSIELNIHMKKDNTVAMDIKASDRDLKNVLEKNSDTLKKSLDTQNISLTDFKVTSVEKSIQTGMSSSAGQGFSQQQNHHNEQKQFSSSQDNSQQTLNQGFSPNNFTNGNNQFSKNSDSDFSFNKYSNQGYVNKNVTFKNMEKNSITNIQRGANGSIKVLV